MSFESGESQEPTSFPRALNGDAFGMAMGMEVIASLPSEVAAQPMPSDYDAAAERLKEAEQALVRAEGYQDRAKNPFSRFVTSKLVAIRKSDTFSALQEYEELEHMLYGTQENEAVTALSSAKVEKSPVTTYVNHAPKRI